MDENQSDGLMQGQLAENDIWGSDTMEEQPDLPSISQTQAPASPARRNPTVRIKPPDGENDRNQREYEPDDPSTYYHRLSLSVKYLSWQFIQFYQRSAVDTYSLTGYPEHMISDDNLFAKPPNFKVQNLEKWFEWVHNNFKNPLIAYRNARDSWKTVMCDRLDELKAKDHKEFNKMLNMIERIKQERENEKHQDKESWADTNLEEPVYMEIQLKEPVRKVRQSLYGNLDPFRGGFTLDNLHERFGEPRPPTPPPPKKVRYNPFDRAEGEDEDKPKFRVIEKMISSWIRRSKLNLEDLMARAEEARPGDPDSQDHFLRVLICTALYSGRGNNVEVPNPDWRLKLRLNGESEYPDAMRSAMNENRRAMSRAMGNSFFEIHFFTCEESKFQDLARDVYGHSRQMLTLITQGEALSSLASQPFKLAEVASPVWALAESQSLGRSHGRTSTSSTTTKVWGRVPTKFRRQSSEADFSGIASEKLMDRGRSLSPRKVRGSMHTTTSFGSLVSPGSPQVSEPPDSPEFDKSHAKRMLKQMHAELHTQHELEETNEIPNEKEGEKHQSQKESKQVAEEVELEIYLSESEVEPTPRTEMEHSVDRLEMSGSSFDMSEATLMAKRVIYEDDFVSQAIEEIHVNTKNTASSDGESPSPSRSTSFSTQGKRPSNSLQEGCSSSGNLLAMQASSPSLSPTQGKSRSFTTQRQTSFGTIHGKTSSFVTQGKDVSSSVQRSASSFPVKRELASVTTPGKSPFFDLDSRSSSWHTMQKSGGSLSLSSMPVHGVEDPDNVFSAFGMKAECRTGSEFDRIPLNAAVMASEALGEVPHSNVNDADVLKRSLYDDDLIHQALGEIHLKKLPDDESESHTLPLRSHSYANQGKTLSFNAQGSALSFISESSDPSLTVPGDDDPSFVVQRKSVSFTTQRNDPSFSVHNGRYLDMVDKTSSSATQGPSQSFMEMKPHSLPEHENSLSISLQGKDCSITTQFKSSATSLQDDLTILDRSCSFTSQGTPSKGTPSISPRGKTPSFSTQPKSRPLTAQESNPSFAVESRSSSFTSRVLPISGISLSSPNVPTDPDNIQEPNKPSHEPKARGMRKSFSLNLTHVESTLSITTHQSPRTITQSVDDKPILVRETATEDYPERLRRTTSFYESPKGKQSLSSICLAPFGGPDTAQELEERNKDPLKAALDATSARVATRERLLSPLRRTGSPGNQTSPKPEDYPWVEELRERIVSNPILPRESDLEQGGGKEPSSGPVRQGSARKGARPLIMRWAEIDKQLEDTYEAICLEEACSISDVIDPDSGELLLTTRRPRYGTLVTGEYKTIGSLAVTKLEERTAEEEVTEAGYCVSAEDQKEGPPGSSYEIHRKFVEIPTRLGEEHGGGQQVFRVGPGREHPHFSPWGCRSFEDKLLKDEIPGALRALPRKYNNAEKLSLVSSKSLQLPFVGIASSRRFAPKNHLPSTSYIPRSLSSREHISDRESCSPVGWNHSETDDLPSWSIGGQIGKPKDHMDRNPHTSARILAEKHQDNLSGLETNNQYFPTTDYATSTSPLRSPDSPSDQELLIAYQAKSLSSEFATSPSSGSTNFARRSAQARHTKTVSPVKLPKLSQSARSNHTNSRSGYRSIKLSNNWDTKSLARPEHSIWESHNHPHFPLIALAGTDFTESFFESHDPGL